MKLARKKYQSKPQTEKLHSAKRMVQPKLEVSQSGDAFEKEADAMAEKVMQSKSISQSGIIAESVQNKTRPKTAEDEKTRKKSRLMRKAEAGAGLQVSSSMASQLAASHQGGTALPAATRGFMEHAFSRDFSQVRIHTGEHAGRMNRELQAKAFTHGNDIYFNSGQYAPDRPEGKSLLAHELTHVVQQEEKTDTPQINRAVEVKGAGKGEASAFGRVGELITRLNQQSAAIQYTLSGHLLEYKVMDPSALTSFDKKMKAFIDRSPVIPMRLLTKEGYVGGQPLWMDSLQEAYVDLDDLLASSDLSFQLNLIHLLAERSAVKNYAKRVGMTDVATKWGKAHPKGLEAEAQHLRDLFADPTIKFLYEDRKAGGTDVFAFKSKEGYYVFHVFPRDRKGIRAGNLYVLTKDKRRITVDDLIRERSAKGKAVDPKLTSSQPQTFRESKADSIAGIVTSKSGSLLSGTVMRKGESRHPSPLSTSFASRLSGSRGSGLPLPGDTRRFMENAFQADFSSVRIHNDEVAGAMSRDIQAKAFTYGNDIFFNSGQYAPQSYAGLKLLAHELTHVLQQEGSFQHSRNTDGISAKTEPVIQRAKEDKSPTKEELEEVESYFENKDGTIETKGKPELHLKSLPYALVKYAIATKRTNFLLSHTERPTNQRPLWIQKKDKMKRLVKDRIETDAKSASKTENNVKYFFFKLKKKLDNKDQFIVGSVDHIVESIVTPTWNKSGENRKFHVDHIIEWQIGGLHELSNFWLWQDTANMSGGSLLASIIDKKIDALVGAAIDAKKAWAVPPKKGKAAFKKDIAKKVKNNFRIWADKIEPGLNVKGYPKDNYNKTEIFNEGAGLDGLKPMTEAEIHKLSGSKSKLAIMIGNRVTANLRKVDNDLKEPRQNWLGGFTLLSVEGYDPDAKAGQVYATLLGEFFPRQSKKKLLKKQLILDIPLIKVPGVPFFGKVENGFTQHVLDIVDFSPFSPVKVEEAYFNESETAVMKGKILPTISFLKDLDIDIIFQGNKVTVQKTFIAEHLRGKLPSPFDITEGELTISIDDELRLGIKGNLYFEIKKLGRGSISGEAGTDGAFSLTGSFEFDKGLFDRSDIKVGYKKLPGTESGEFSFEGSADKESKNKLFKKAHIQARYEKGILTAKGDAETKLPGIEKGSIEVITGKGETTVVADFLFTDKIPGVKSGNLHFLFQKKEDGTFVIQANALIQTKFPGIPTVQLAGFYNSDGVFLFEGEALIALERFKGKIKFGITNREVDETGKLTDKMGEKLVPYGEGTVNFKMTDWLNGNIGAKVTPDARTVLSGALIPDPHLPITKQPDPINKKFGQFSLPKFTLFGIPKIAEIFVTASGGLYFNASIGPLYLNNASLTFDQLDIAAPEKTIVQGQGQLDIPASAELGVEASIIAGLGILLVAASVKLTGSIGFAITGNAGIAFGFQWSKGTGFKAKEAIAHLKAKSELVARLKGELNVDLDLWLTTVNLYNKKLGEKEKRWPLGLDIDSHFPLGFGTGDEGAFQVPDPNTVKHSEPKVDEDAVKKAATEEPPVTEPAPGKEKVLAKLRWLEADATVDAGWLSEHFERYSYAKRLKEKYPHLEWSYVDVELKLLDAKEFDRLRRQVLDTSRLPLTEMGKKFRLIILDDFEEKHLYVNLSGYAELRRQIDILHNPPPPPPSEPVSTVADTAAVESSNSINT